MNDITQTQKDRAMKIGSEWIYLIDGRHMPHGIAAVRYLMDHCGFNLQEAHAFIQSLKSATEGQR